MRTRCQEIAQPLERILPSMRRPSRSAERRAQEATDVAHLTQEVLDAGLDLDRVPLAISPLALFYRCMHARLSARPLAAQVTPSTSVSESEACAAQSPAFMSGHAGRKKGNGSTR